MPAPPAGSSTTADHPSPCTTGRGIPSGAVIERPHSEQEPVGVDVDLEVKIRTFHGRRNGRGREGELVDTVNLEVKT